MTKLDGEIARYHKPLESNSFKDLSWADALQEKMQEQHLTAGGRLISPVLRPHFVTQRQYANVTKAAESLYSAINRIEKLALHTPTLMSRIDLPPPETILPTLHTRFSYL